MERKLIAILWVTLLSGPLSGETFGIPYLTMESCVAAKPIISATLEYDHNMICREATP